LNFAKHFLGSQDFKFFLFYCHIFLFLHLRISSNLPLPFPSFIFINFKKSSEILISIFRFVIFGFEGEKEKMQKQILFLLEKLQWHKTLFLRLDNFERMSPQGWIFLLPISILPRRQRNDSYYHHNRV
jgi:hypothetical protein